MYSNSKTHFNILFWNKRFLKLIFNILFKGTKALVFRDQKISYLSLQFPMATEHAAEGQWRPVSCMSLTMEDWTLTDTTPTKKG